MYLVYIKSPTIRWGIGWGLALWICLQCFSLGTVSVASDPEWKSQNLPTKPSDIDGFTCRVEVLNAVSEGYIPLRVTATSTVGTFPGDRPIRLEIAPQYGNRPKPHTLYSTKFVLPSGKSTYTETFYLPKYFEGGAFEVKLTDPSGSLKSYSANFMIALENKISGPENLITASDWLTRVAIILPDPGTVRDEAWAVAPDFRSLDSMLEVDQNFILRGTRQTDAEALNYLKSQSRLASQLLTADTAHENWLGYESVDVILIALPVLEAMKTSEPNRFAAIREWASCGGVIWTYGFADTKSLESVFDAKANTVPELSTRSNRTSVDPIDRAYNNYTPANRSSNLQRVVDPYNYATGFYSQSQRQIDDPLAKFANPNDPDHPFTAKKLVEEYKAEIVSLPVEAGIVIGMKQDDPFPGSLQQWFIVKNLSGAAQHFRYRRAISVTRGAGLYWEWLLNNVARPPVYAFLGLLSIFVLLVGPVSYHFTRRASRAYLMFIIAPVLATFTTLALFGYGFIADGFGTKARIRQITIVDGDSGRASESNRATYFASFRPSSGLRFRADAAVYPVVTTEDAIEDDYSITVRYDRSVELTESEQIFKGEFLPSRTQSQFLSYYPVRESTGLRIGFDGSKWTVKNEFTAPIESVILRLPSNTYWTLDQPLAAGETNTLVALKSNDALKNLRELYRQNQPAVPLGYTPDNVRSSMGWYNYNNVMNVLNNPLPVYIDSGDELGLYEARLRRLLFDVNQLPLGWFAATLEVQPEASAVPNASILESVHYAIGSLNLKEVKDASFVPVADADIDEEEQP